MGASCCSHSKEPPEITIFKPEKNIIDSNINNTGEYYNNNFQIIDLEQNGNNQNQNIITTSNVSEQPIDINSYQNNSSPLTQKEIDDLLNQALSNPTNSPQINYISNDNNNIITTTNNINNIASTEQYQNIDLNNFYQNQNQNNQNIPLEQEIDKYISNQPINQNEIQKQQQQNNIDLNIEEILKKQSNNTNSNNDIEELLKNTESKVNNQIDNNNLNLDALFNQTGNAQISDEFINKLFEATDKRNNNSNPLYFSQQAPPVQFKEALPTNNQYYSPGNSPQRSEVVQHFQS